MVAPAEGMIEPVKGCVAIGINGKWLKFSTCSAEAPVVRPGDEDEEAELLLVLTSTLEPVLARRSCEGCWSTG